MSKPNINPTFFHHETSSIIRCVPLALMDILVDSDWWVCYTAIPAKQVGLVNGIYVFNCLIHRSGFASPDRAGQDARRVGKYNVNSTNGYS